MLSDTAASAGAPPDLLTSASAVCVKQVPCCLTLLLANAPLLRLCMAMLGQDGPLHIPAACLPRGKLELTFEE
jgi:hypothetical protein